MDDINGKTLQTKPHRCKNTRFGYWISEKILKCFTANQYRAITHAELIPTLLLLLFSRGSKSSCYRFFPCVLSEIRTRCYTTYCPRLPTEHTGNMCWHYQLHQPLYQVVFFMTAALPKLEKLLDQLLKDAKDTTQFLFLFNLTRNRIRIRNRIWNRNRDRVGR